MSQYRKALSRSFIIKVSLCLVSVIGVFALFVGPNAQAISEAKKQACIGNLGSLGYTSPFSVTNKQCIGQDSSGNVTYYQFAVELPIANSSATVSAKNGNGTSINFVKQSDTLYVSKPDTNDQTAGYKGSVPVDGVSNCNPNDGINKVTITAKASNKTQVFPINLCENATTYVIGKLANELRTGNNGTQAPSPSFGCIKASLGLIRDDPTPNWTADQRNAMLQQSGVTYIKVDGPTSHEVTKAADFTSASTKEWFALEDGQLSISKLKPGQYTVTIRYDDKRQIIKDIGQGNDAWTTGDITYTLNVRRVAAGSSCSQYNDGKTEYRSATTGKVTEKNDAEDTDSQATTCAIEGLGWIVCPVTKFMANISDGAYSVVTEFLEVRPELVASGTSSERSGTYTAWSAFRNIANVAFVIVFLVIIFSQMSGVGVSNYGVKKTLPRLIIAAILVNISYFICQLMVDITQILGVSLKEFLGSIKVASIDKDIYRSFSDIISDTLGGTGLILLMTTAAVGGVVIVALSISSSVLLAALIAIMLTVIILVARQAAIVMLIAISPLAFVAYLLPNTEQWFKRWLKVFWGLLLVFPIISLLYGGGELASNILAAVASKAAGGQKFWLSVMSVGVSMIPLIMTPFMLKGSLDATGKIGGKISGIASKANGRIGRSAKTSSRLGEAQQGLKNRFALQRAMRRASSTRQQAIDNSRVGKILGLNKGGARAIQAIDQEQDTEVSARVAQIQHATTSTNRVEGSAVLLKKAIAENDITTARAAQKILMSSGAYGLNELQKTYTDDAVANNLVRDDRKELTGFLRSEVNSAGLKGKNNVLARWGYQGAADSIARPQSGLDGNTFATHEETVTKLNSVELAGQSISNLRQAEQHVTPSAAAAVLSNATAAGLLDNDKREWFENIARRGQSGTAGNPTPNQTGTDTGTNTQNTFGNQQANQQQNQQGQPDPSGQQNQSNQPEFREFSRKKIETMGPENVRRAVDVRGGYENLHEGDLMSIRNAHGNSEAGQAARQELINRGVIKEQTPRDPESMPKIPKP